MPPVIRCDREAISIESILNAPNPTDLVQLIRKNRGIRGNPIVFNDSESENQRNSFPLKFLDVPAAEKKTKKSFERNGGVSDIENQHEKSSEKTSKVAGVFPMRQLFPRVKVKRLRQSLARRSLIKDMEATPITSIFHTNANSTSMQQFGLPDAISTPIQRFASPIVLSSGSYEADDNTSKNTRPNPLINSIVGGNNTIKQSVSLHLDATKHHQNETLIEDKSTGNAANSGTKYYHESIEISGEVNGTIVNEIQVENQAHFAQISQQHPANRIGANTTLQTELPLRTPQKNGQNPDSSVIISTLIKNIRRSEENIRKTISASKIPRRVILNNGKPNRPTRPLLSPGRSSVVVMPIYPPTCHNNKKGEKSVEQQQQSVVNATCKSLTEKVADQSSDKHAAACSITTSCPPVQFQITSDEDSSKTNQEIPCHQCSPLRQAHPNRVENSNRSAGNLREIRHFDVAIVGSLNQQQAESHHMAHSSSQAIDLRLSCRRSSNLPTSHEESRHHLQPTTAMGNESNSDSNDSGLSSENIEKINDNDSLPRHNSSETGAEQHQLPEIVENLTNRENAVSPSDEFNESVFEGVTGREGRPNDIVFDLSPDRGKLWIDLALRKDTTGANRKETAGASRSLFKRRRGKRVVSEIVSKQSQTLIEEIKSSLRKSNRRNSNRNSKRKLYSHVGEDIENGTENRLESHSENQSPLSEKHHTNSPVCKLFGFFSPIVLGAAHKKRQARNLKHAKTTRIATTQKLLDSWRQESKKRQHDQQPKESLRNDEEEEPIFKVPKPPTRRKPMRTKLSAKNAGKNSSLRSGIAAQPSASQKSSISTDRSNKSFESKANQQYDDDSFTTETPIQNDYRKYSRTTDQTIKNSKSKSKSLQSQRSKSATRVSFANISDHEQIDSVLAGTANKSKQSQLTTPRQHQLNNTVNSELQSNPFPEMRRPKAYNEITGIELIEEVPSLIVPPPSRKREEPARKSKIKSVGETLPAPTSNNSPKTNGLRRSARKHHAPRPYWTNDRNFYPIVEVNYKDPVLEGNRKRKTVPQPNKSKKKKKIEMIAEPMAGANNLSGSKKIADNLFDALKELSQTNDPSINTIRSKSVAAASVSREDSPKPSKRPRKYTKKKTAVVAKNTTTVADSGVQTSDQEGANPQGNTTVTNNCLLSWLQNLVGPQTINSHPALHHMFELSGVTIVPSQCLTFSSVDGVDYAYYDDSVPDSEHYGYMRFNPNAIKRTAKTKKFELRFLCIVGELSITADETSVQLKEGAFITILKGVKYSLANRSEETALIFFIKT